MKKTKDSERTPRNDAHAVRVWMEAMRRGNFSLGWNVSDLLMRKRRAQNQKKSPRWFQMVWDGSPVHDPWGAGWDGKFGVISLGQQTWTLLPFDSDWALAAAAQRQSMVSGFLLQRAQVKQLR